MKTNQQKQNLQNGKQIGSNCYLCGKSCLHKYFSLIYINKKLELIHQKCYPKNEKLK
jgi:hypothetical protein